MDFFQGGRKKLCFRIPLVLAVKKKINVHWKIMVCGVRYIILTVIFNFWLLIICLTSKRVVRAVIEVAGLLTKVKT